MYGAAMLHRVFTLSDLVLLIGGSISFVSGVIGKLVAFAQTDPIMAGGTTVAMVAGLVAAITPLVLRVVDLQRLRDRNRRLNAFIQTVEQRSGALDSENRRLREFIVRSSREHDFDLPEWFYAEPPSNVGTGDHALLLPPGSDEAPKGTS